MLQYMLDTNICIYVIKNYPPQLRERFNRLAEQLCISSITLAELHYGAEKSARCLENLQAVEHFSARIEVLAFSPKAAVHFGRIRMDVERSGKPAGAFDMFDMLIGAHARAEGLTVVTNNACEFRRLPGVRVENWVGEGGSPG
jgi:tRNA(fMet)-specific endonuclease VapC